ncbi:MAG: MATE family efflux transporter [Prevotella sp.]|nr:MATE family efflux transporter [Prevotella sp.]
MIRELLQKYKNTDARTLKMRMNTIYMMFLRCCSILITLISAPIMLTHVDRAEYGVLMTLTSIVNWVSMMDIGLGNGLRNKLSGYLANNEISKAKEAVSSCYGALALYVSILIGVFLVASPFVNWTEFLNSPQSNEQEFFWLANIVFISFSINFLFGLINSILFAYQMPAFQSLFMMLGQVFALVALIIQVYVFDVSSILLIGSFNCIIPPCVTLIGSLFLFRGRMKEVAPSLKLVNFKTVNSILSLGIKFFVLQIITIVLFQANNIIIAKSVNPESVVEYNLAFKYISVITMIFTIVLTPIWSATTDAYVRGDFDWIKRTMTYLRKVCLGTICLGGVMVLASKFVYSIWLGKDVIDIPYTTTALVWIYISLEMMYKMYVMIVNGIGKVYAQMIITGVIAVLYIPLAYLMGRAFGIIGVLSANCIVFFFNYLWVKIQCTKLINQTASGFWLK